MTESKETRDIKDIAGELSDRDFKVLLKAKQQAQVRVAQEPNTENVRTLNKINKALQDLDQQKKRNGGYVHSSIIKSVGCYRVSERQRLEGFKINCLWSFERGKD